MILGKIPPLISIPPGIPEYPTKSRCTDKCTSQMPGDINIFGFISHGHLTAASVMTDLQNPDGQVEQLGEKRFHFNYQVTRLLNPPIVAKKGFNATTTCMYNSSMKTNVTNGGEETADEMCYNFILYYPKENGLAFCMDDELGMKEGCIVSPKVNRP
jgi:hypothetical protein